MARFILMAILHRPKETGSHWYTASGEPMHEVPRADGNGTRPTTVADARKMSLLPSVTNVLNVLAKPSLDSYKIEQAIRAAMSSPKSPDESEDYYIARIAAQSREPVVAAADLGTQIHHAIETRQVPEHLAAYVTPVLEWLDSEPRRLIQEQTVTCPEHGFAGRVDVIFETANTYGIIDFKTRKTTPSRSITPYDGHGEQLAAYARGVFGRRRVAYAQLINIYISTNEPGRFHVHHHQRTGELFTNFRAAMHLWIAARGYDPRHAPARRPRLGKMRMERISLQT